MPFYLLLSIYILIFGSLAAILIRIVALIVKYTVKLTIWIVRHLLILLYKFLRYVTTSLYKTISTRCRVTEVKEHEKNRVSITELARLIVE